MVGLNLLNLDGANGFKIAGQEQFERLGTSVSEAGDVNGDGFGDIILGGSSTAAYVIFGKGSGHDPELNLATLDGSNGFKISGEYRYLGTVSGAGDVNDDGYSDLVVSATYSDECYVIFGKANGLPATVDVSLLDGNNGFTIAGDSIGHAVSGAGDVNGDGKDDLILGADASSPNGEASGAAYVVFGRDGFPARLNLAELDGRNGFKLAGEAAGDRAGRSVSGAGDLNGDGFADAVIGADEADATGEDSGASYVIFGKGTVFPAMIELSTLDGSDGFKMAGEAARNHFGGSVSGAGDINADGLDDLVIGAYLANLSDDFNGEESGASYVIFGKAASFGASLDLSTLNGANGFKIEGDGYNTHLGISVGAAGDVNGDGRADLLIGTDDIFSGRGGGVSFVVFGKVEGFAATLVRTQLGVADGFNLYGESKYDKAGTTVSGAGDFNGDGLADLIIGAESSETNGLSSGAAYLVFGRPFALVAETKRSVSFNEPDGDRVTIALSKGSIAEENITLRPVGSGFLLAELELTKTAQNQNARVRISVAPGSQAAAIPEFMKTGRAEVGLVKIASEARVAELRVEGDLTALEATEELLAGGLVRSMHVTSLGAARALFPEHPAELHFGSRVERVEVAEDVRHSAVILDGGGGRLDVGGDWLDSTLFTAGKLNTLKVDGLVRDSTLSGITAAQPKNAAATTVFGTVTIGQNLERSQILVGYDQLNTPTRGGSIGSVTIGGNLVASDLVAGAVSGTDQIFGTRDDLGITDEDFFVSKIGRITIRGGVEGSAADGDGHGFVAEWIGSVRVSGNKVDLESGAKNDLVAQRVGATEDVRVREVQRGAVVRVELAKLDGRTGFVMQGEHRYSFDGEGHSISGAGDINADGFDDLVIGFESTKTYGLNVGPAGASFVVFGRASGMPAEFDLTTLDGTNGFKITGEAAGDFFGGSASGAGDVNGDGIDDLIIGAYGADLDGTNVGATYVIFGKTSAFTPTLEVATLEGTNGFKILGDPSALRSGFQVSGAGDVNGDGKDDVVIANHRGFAFTSDSASYVVFGASAFSATLNLAGLDGLNGFKVESELFDFESVSGAGDVNGDGFDDVILGCGSASTDGALRGASYVIFGKAAGFSAMLSVSSLDGTNGFKVIGEREFDHFGESVSGAGDMNGDGRDDVVIGTTAGVGYVVFGRAGGFSATLEAAALDGANGFKLQGEGPGDGFGSAVSGAGDVNGDGFSDVIIGAYKAPAGALFTPGASYIILGHGGPFAPTLRVSTLNGSNGIKITGGGEFGDESGLEVSGAGDFNGDGFDDVLVAAPDTFRGIYPDNTFGATYAIFGTPAVQIDEQTVAYTDAEGNRVIVQVQNGTISTGALEFEEVGDQKIYHVKTLDLSAESLNGAVVTVTADPAFAADEIAPADAGNVGIPNIGTLILPPVGGPASVNIGGNVKNVTVPATAALKVFKVQSLGADAGLFPDIPARFSGAGTIVKFTVVGDVTDFVFDVPGLVDQMAVGGNITGSDLDFSSKIAKFSVNGNIADSTLTFAKGAQTLSVKGNLTSSHVHAGTKMDQIIVGGNLANSHITAQGVLQPTSATLAVALGKITVTGNVDASRILAGYDVNLLNVNPDARVGAVSITGMLRMSDLVAGARVGGDGIFGTGDDDLAGGGAKVVAKIASILIKGGVEGTAAPGDGFGLVAEEIGSLRIGKTRVLLKAGPGNNPTPILLGGTDDVRVREVAV